MQAPPRNLGHARDLLQQATKDWRQDQQARLDQATRLAVTAHEGQYRRSGEEYACHPLAVAATVAQHGGDVETVIAALLHDVVEDTTVSLREIEEHFGERVARLVDGCTKVAGLRVRGPDALEAARLRKLLVALARDPQVLVIKIADRLHNLQTIDALPAEKARRIGRETLTLYVPLGHRLGLGGLNTELEDLAFAAAEPQAYARLHDRLNRPELHARLAAAQERLAHHLAASRLSASVSGRIKRPWSAYRKAVRDNVSVDDLHDLVGLRVVVADTASCYLALGLVHQLWLPIDGKFKDYVARPKFNSYQSLHTLVQADGEPVEVQIRSEHMHHSAEEGAAAHHIYKTGEPAEPEWLRRLLDYSDSDEGYLEQVRTDLSADEELHVLTPRGSVVTLPAGAGVLDFAYAVHTEVGDACSGARVNGQLVPLTTRLQTGDRVEILTERTGGPDAAWLDFVVTHKAKERIRGAHSGSARHARITGWAALDRELSLLGLDRIDLARSLPTGISAARAAELVGRGQVRAADAAAGRWDESTDRAASLHLVARGLASTPVSIARCCKPGPADAAVGVQESRRVLAHRRECPTARDATETKVHPVRWVSGGTTWAVLTVCAEDRSGLLGEVAAAINAAGGDISASRTESFGDGTCREEFDILLPQGAGVGVSRIVSSVIGVESVALR